MAQIMLPTVQFTQIVKNEFYIELVSVETTIFSVPCSSHLQ